MSKTVFFKVCKMKRCHKTWNYFVITAQRHLGQPPGIYQLLQKHQKYAKLTQSKLKNKIITRKKLTALCEGNNSKNGPKI